MKLTERIIYSGEYRNIHFEINKFKSLDFNRERGHSNCWAHYIYINLDKHIPDEKLANSFWLEPIKYGKRISHNYYVYPINELVFHCGCTWYSKESGFEGDNRIVKIGCDYQHLWDDGHDYNLEYVVNEAKNTIDSLWELTQIKKWCFHCGEYDLEENFQNGYCIYCKNKRK